MRNSRVGTVCVAAVAAGCLLAVACSPGSGEDPLANFEEGTRTGGDPEGLAELQALAIASWEPVGGTVDWEEASPGGSTDEVFAGGENPSIHRSFDFVDEAALDAATLVGRSLIEADGFALKPVGNDRPCCRYYEGPLGIAAIRSRIDDHGIPTMTMDIDYFPEIPEDVMEREEQRAQDEPPE